MGLSSVSSRAMTEMTTSNSTSVNALDLCNRSCVAIGHLSRHKPATGTNCPPTCSLRRAGGLFNDLPAGHAHAAPGVMAQQDGRIGLEHLHRYVQAGHGVELHALGVAHLAVLDQPALVQFLLDIA